MCSGMRLRPRAGGRVRRKAVSEWDAVWVQVGDMRGPLPPLVKPSGETKREGGGTGAINKNKRGANVPRRV